VIVVTGWYELDPGERDAFVASRADGVRKARGEQGNLEYNVAPDLLEPGRVVLTERWEDQASLDAHLAAARSAPPPTSQGPALKGISVMVYDVTGERKLA
jgi:quinol monooxygenase YgiN